jgi:hypothetical protein
MKAANFSEMLVNQPTKRSSRNHSRWILPLTWLGMHEMARRYCELITNALNNPSLRLTSTCTHLHDIKFVWYQYSLHSHKFVTFYTQKILIQNLLKALCILLLLLSNGRSWIYSSSLLASQYSFGNSLEVWSSFGHTRMWSIVFTSWQLGGATLLTSTAFPKLYVPPGWC